MFIFKLEIKDAKDTINTAYYDTLTGAQAAGVAKLQTSFGKTPYGSWTSWKYGTGVLHYLNTVEASAMGNLSAYIEAVEVLS